MTKRLCKLNRRDIQEHLGDIHRLVAEPKFVCRSCARSADDQSRLCKPAAIPPISCQNRAQKAEQSQCGLLQEVLSSSVSQAEKETEDVSRPVALQKSTESAAENQDSKASLKKAKKALKKQKKHLKAMKKVLKKQRKLAKKHLKLQRKIEQVSIPSSSEGASCPPLH
ncbi:hypothetical protein [Vibrio agarivorans]|uniref:Uncharacterized protein n=1 Tax=Vibrio agarivorans TaxID=153622 RepID=A0ABT7XVM6_9VIBR|nr:hypothetical protein [Vibrio agarivorans]MDN2479829.1 hypothetical protein [Vibrio agarivorans]